MLFGRKTPPAAPPAAPKTEGAAAKPAGEASVHASPLASLTTAPNPAPAAPAAASAAPPAHSLPAHSLPAMAGPADRPAFSDPTSSAKGPEMNSSIPKPPSAPSLPGAAPAATKTDVPRRMMDLPGVTPRPASGLASPSTPFGAPTPPAASAPVAPAMPALPEQRRLTVGRDISLSGEIGSCDVLVVEGTVEAKLRNGRSIEIADGGLFKGSVEIEEADIGGRFEGDIAVRGRLVVRSTGKITGSIKYGELSVEAGGRLVGDIQLYVAAPSVASAPAAPVVAPALATADV